MLCPLCNIEMKFIPPGVSKTSRKKYNAFFSCPECKQTMNAELKVEQSIHPIPVHQKPVSNGSDKATKSMVLSYSKDLVIAMIAAGIALIDPTTEVIGVYHRFMTEIEK